MVPSHPVAYIAFAITTSFSSLIAVATFAVSGVDRDRGSLLLSASTVWSRG